MPKIQKIGNLSFYFLFLLQTFHHDFPNLPLVLDLVLHEHFTCSLVRRRKRIRVPQQRTNRYQYCPCVVYWTPLCIQYVQTYPPICIYVRVEHLTRELHLRTLVRVLVAELEGEFEHSSFPWSSLWTLHQSLHLVHVLGLEVDNDAAIFFLLDFLKVFFESSESWLQRHSL